MTLEELSVSPVDDIDGDRASYGHDDLAGTVADFCDRWKIGVQHLAADGQEVADRLDHCVQAYRRADQGASDRLHGILSRTTGTYPAAG